MTVNNILTADRTGTYEVGGTFVQWADATNAVKIAFATAWNLTLSVDDFDIDRIDSAAPIFTKKSDIIGTFSFDLKNAVSLYETAATPIDDLLVSKWLVDIKNGEPPSIKFAPVMKSVETATNPFVNFIFTGRIMNIPIDQVLDQGVQDLSLLGEVTDFTQARREATANNEG